MNSDERSTEKQAAGRARGSARRRIPRIRFEGESGQIIVLIALLMIVLLGLIALAIDGGGLFFLNRDAQNAADSAAIAAAYAKCTDGSDTSMINAGMAAAAFDGFDDNGTTNTVQINPDTPSAGYVEAVIWASKPSYFAQVVFPQPLSVTVHSIGQCLGTFDPSKVKAIVGLGECGVCSSPIVDSSGSVSTIDGGIVSGCECDFNASTTFGATIIDGMSCYGETSTNCADYGNGVTCVDPSTATIPTDPPEDPLAGVFTLERYRLSAGGKFAQWADADNQCVNTPQQIPTGVGNNRDLYAANANGSCYHFINGDVVLNASRADDYYFEGLYYINGELDLAEVAIGPAGATFVLTDGNTHRADWSPPFADIQPYDPGPDNPSAAVCNPSDPSYDPTDPQCVDPPSDYLLIYTARDSFAWNPTDTSACNDTNIQFTGANTNWAGILYSPHGGCSWSGSGTLTANGAMVCYLVDYSGSTVDITWDPQQMPPIAPDVRYGLP